MTTRLSKVYMRFIVAGIILLLISLILSIVAMYSYTATNSARILLNLDNGTASSALFQHIPLNKLKFLRNASVEINNTCGSTIEYYLLKKYGSNYTIGLRDTVKPYQVKTIKSIGVEDVIVLRAQGDCESVVLNYHFSRRLYPFKMLSIPSLILMISGTAVLSFGAILRLSGVEDF